MKVHGYSQGDADRPDVQFGEELMEVTLEATPAELRAIAAFLSDAAGKMEGQGARYHHEHLADVMPEFRGSPHFVVFNANLANH